jgi:hypothetical protein
LILTREDPSYRLVSKISITNPPIRVLATKTNGWHDIAVGVREGGVNPGYEARLRFDGNTYPSNPSMLPARPTGGQLAGKIVVPSTFDELIPVYY